MRAALRHPAAWWWVLGLGLLPMAWLVQQTLLDQLGANPAETLIRATGDWTLRSLCVVLAVSPLRSVLGWPELMRFRRLLGLLVFAYACVHLLCYAWFDMGFDLADTLQDIAKRPFILVGFASFVLLTPLAATSFNAAIKAMGAKRWQLLHQLVYLISGLGLLHFFWMRAGKNDFAEVFVYAAIIAVLLGWRVRRYLVKKG